ncbi:MAG: hypothetical protein ACI8S6_004976 [Myxococcota bacterium]|jgi:hypothetical protein
MWALMLALGCAPYTKEQFADDLDAASCDWQADCFGYQDTEQCIVDAQASRDGPPGAGCDLDEGAAEECVADFERMACPDAEEEDVVFPEACLAAWSCE